MSTFINMIGDLSGAKISFNPLPRPSGGGGQHQSSVMAAHEEDMGKTYMFLAKQHCS